MSDALTDAQMLSIWERGIALGTTGRALLILSVGGPRADLETSRDWSVGRRDAALLEIRRTTFGASLASRTRCPRCNCELEFALDAATLRQLGPSPGASESLTLQHDDAQITVRAPTSADFLAAERLGAAPEVEADLWRRCVVVHTADGTLVVPECLTPAQRDAAEAALERSDPRMDLSVDLECRDCGMRWDCAYDIAHVLWLEIVQHARGVLQHIHLLASRYGWTEREVLSLGQQRREMYLALPE